MSRPGRERSPMRTIYFTPKRLKNLQVGISACRYERESRVRRHTHTYFELLYLLEGQRTLVTRRGRYKAGVGDLIIFYPNEAHEEVSPAGRLVLLVLRFPQLRLGHKLRFPEKRDTPPVVSLPWPERFRHLFEQMILEKAIQDTWSNMMSKVYMIEFVVSLRRALQSLAGRKQSSPTGKLMRIEKAIEIIHKGLPAEFSLNKLARQTFMSQSRFSHLFKEFTGISPKHYFLQTKMAKAKELLTAGDRPIKAIAADLGYLDEHYFSRAFKKLTGVAPAQFRAGSRKVHVFGKTVHSRRT